MTFRQNEPVPVLVVGPFDAKDASVQRRDDIDDGQGGTDVTDIRSLSKGRASAGITPSHFEQVPNSLLAKIVETSSKAPART